MAELEVYWQQMHVTGIGTYQEYACAAFIYLFVGETTALSRSSGQLLFNSFQIVQLVGISA